MALYHYCIDLMMLKYITVSKCVLLLQLINSTLPLSKITKSKQSTAKTSGERKCRNSESVDFYLHMTHYCVIGDNTLLLTFQLDDQVQPDDILVVRL